MFKEFLQNLVPIFKDFWEKKPIEFARNQVFHFTLDIQCEGKVGTNQVSEPKR